MKEAFTCEIEAYLHLTQNAGHLSVAIFFLVQYIEPTASCPAVMTRTQALSVFTRSTKMAACSSTRLVKEVVVVNGLPTVVSKILPERSIHKHVIVVIPGNPGLVEFYDDFISTLFNSLHGQWPVYAIAHAGRLKLDTLCVLFSTALLCCAVCKAVSKTSLLSLVSEENQKKKIR